MAAQGDNHSGVVIEGSIEKFPRQDARVEGNLSEEIERELRLYKEEVPELEREILVDAGKDGEKVLLEGVDDALGGVVAMHVGGHKLVLDVPVIFNDTLLLDACFIVEDLRSTLWPRTVRWGMMDPYAVM